MGRISRRLPQLPLWQWARGEGGGARNLPGGVQHLWQEVNTTSLAGSKYKRETKREFKKARYNDTQNTAAVFRRRIKVSFLSVGQRAAFTRREHNDIGQY